MPVLPLLIAYNMNEQEVKLLLRKYNNGQATPQEKALLENWYLQEGRKQSLSDEELDVDRLKEELWLGTLERAGLVEPERIRTFPWYRMVAAAVLVLGLAVGFYFYLHSPPFAATQQLAQAIDVAPGGNRATLTLADGRTIDLSDDKKGLVVDAGGLVYDDGTQVALSNANNLGKGNETQLNTISTPKGGQYKVTLPDGSQVWLNAASSLTYPVRFGDNERRVQLKGEGYFEVASIASSGTTKMPFVVETQDQEVAVQGTHFNISGYEDEKTVKTTLLEGAVTVFSLKGGGFRQLKAGEQSIVEEGRISVSSVDIEEAVAWKNGEFVFYNQDIKTVMKKIARWYDVEVVYEAPMDNLSIWGSVSRFKNISEVLKMIELTGSVHFKISEGVTGKERRVHVMK